MTILLFDRWWKQHSRKKSSNFPPFSNCNWYILLCRLLVLVMSVCSETLRDYAQMKQQRWQWVRNGESEHTVHSACWSLGREIFLPELLVKVVHVRHVGQQVGPSLPHDTAQQVLHQRMGRAGGHETVRWHALRFIDHYFRKKVLIESSPVLWSLCFNQALPFSENHVKSGTVSSPRLQTPPYQCAPGI